MYFHNKHILTIKIELLLKIHLLIFIQTLKGMESSTNSRLILAQLGKQLFTDESNWGGTDLEVKPINSIEEMSKQIALLAEQISQEVGIEDWRTWLCD